MKKIALLLVFLLTASLVGCVSIEEENLGNKVFEIVVKDYVDSYRVVVFKDLETGCFYMTKGQSGVTPRLDSDGNPMCGKK